MEEKTLKEEIENMQNALTSLRTLGYGEDVGVMISNMEKKLTRLKEKRVLEIHKNVISTVEKTKGGTTKTYFRTKLNGKQKTALSYDKLIDDLYEVYFGNVPAHLPKNLREVFESWSQYFYETKILTGHKSSDTLRRYKIDWNKFVEDSYLAEKSVSLISEGDLFDFYSIITANSAITRKNLGNVKSLINHLLRYAKDTLKIDVLCKSSPSTVDLNCKNEDNSMSVYTNEERALIMNQCKYEENRVYARAIALQFCLCARVGEIKSLYWEDIDFESRTIYIHTEMVAGPDGKEIRVNHTKAKSELGNRYEHMTDTAYCFLMEQREESNGNQFVFTYNSSPLTTHVYNEVLKRICNKAHVQYHSSHKIRFWSVTAMNDAGVGKSQMQKTAGHLTPSTTERYIRPGRLPEIDKKVWDKIFN